MKYKKEKKRQINENVKIKKKKPRRLWGLEKQGLERVKEK